MATSSFHEDLVLDSSLAVAGMQNAIDACGILESVIPSAPTAPSWTSS